MLSLPTAFTDRVLKRTFHGRLAVVDLATIALQAAGFAVRAAEEPSDLLFANPLPERDGRVSRFGNGNTLFSAFSSVRLMISPIQRRQNRGNNHRGWV